MVVNLFETLELVQEPDGRFFSHAFHPRDIVRGIADESLQVRYLRRMHPVFQQDGLVVIELDFGEGLTGSKDFDIVVDQLHSIGVAGHDDCLQALRRGLPGQRAEDVIRFVPFQLVYWNVEGPHNFPHPGELPDKFVGRLGTVLLVRLELFMPESRRSHVKSTGHTSRLQIRQRLEHGRGVARPGAVVEGQGDSPGISLPKNIPQKGEAGVGKELYARYLHNNSSHRDGPFITIAVGSISPENSTVEFFGKESMGKVYPGLLERAHKGTLFLGEIAGMDKETQLRLLSALESSSFLRVGGGEPVWVDVRVIASTRMALDEEVKSGRFRQDLYYLLNEVTLDIQPLRAHSEDVPSLLSFYVDYFVNQDKVAFRRFSMAAQNFLRNYSWRGNVRELKNLVQRLLILGVGEDIELEEVKAALGSVIVDSMTNAVPDFFNLPLKEARDHFEKAYLEYHFERTGGSVAKLSAAVGMERTHLYRKLHSLNIKL